MYSWNTLELTQCSVFLTSCFFTIWSVSWEDTQVESTCPLLPVIVWSLRTDMLRTSQIPCRNSGWTPRAGETECVCGLGVEAGDWAGPPWCLVEGYWLLVSGSGSPAPAQMKNVDEKSFVSYWAACVKPFRPFKTATLRLWVRDRLQVITLIFPKSLRSLRMMNCAITMQTVQKHLYGDQAFLHMDTHTDTHIWLTTTTNTNNNKGKVW